ncbi:MAG: hypothetical protein K0R26_1556 [Bacteroidota bacterium]|jgi:hypothetical protein|nr:hypothetical protein [Bacteroidota bacterium]
MATGKKLGIWLDHSRAHFIEFPNGNSNHHVIESEFTREAKQEALKRGEHTMNSKEQQKQSEFYKAIGEVIKNYNEVLLFGPSDARLELFNILKANHHFENIKIEVQSAEKMSESEQENFVNDYFCHTIKK